MKIVITGSRGWRDVTLIRDALTSYQALTERRGDDLTVIHGHCPKGADRIADALCDDLGIPKKREPADWARHGKAAGPLRNQLMLDKYHPDLVLAFRAAGKSNGTDDMIDRAERAKVRVVTLHEKTTAAA